MRYKIVENISTELLVHEVNEALTRGWRLHGRPYVTSDPAPSHFQAMIKPDAIERLADAVDGDMYIVVYTPVGGGDLCHKAFDDHTRALAFVTGEGDSGLDWDVEDDKAVIINCANGDVEDHT